MDFFQKYFKSPDKCHRLTIFRRATPVTIQHFYRQPGMEEYYEGLDQNRKTNRRASSQRDSA
jgi:hypothetical protein